MNLTELKPCPICGHKKSKYGNDGQQYCKKCGACGPDPNLLFRKNPTTQEDAEKAWNTRYDPNPWHKYPEHKPDKIDRYSIAFFEIDVQIVIVTEDFWDGTRFRKYDGKITDFKRLPKPPKE